MPMIAQPVQTLHDLYERDETAWLEVMAELAAEGRAAELDLPNLSEYLNDMARRDRREVNSRLALLLMHLLKWEFQPERRSGSWRATIRVQRTDLRMLLESCSLWNHAEAILHDVYAEATKIAADETGLPLEVFPEECGWKLADVLAESELPI